jgi:CRISPR-associated protein Csm1
MDSNKNAIFLASLLHDIGKFYQRADEQSVEKSKLLSAEIKKLETELCPVFKGKYSHKHVLWTAQFFKDFEKHFRNVLGREKSISFDNLMHMSAAHHKPRQTDLAEKIIQKSDHYSSGVDRSNNENTQLDIQDENSLPWDRFKKIMMLSVFESVSLSKQTESNWEAEYSYKLPLNHMVLKDDFFPKKNNTQAPDYQKLWKGFVEEFELIQAGSFKSFGNTLLYLLEKYTCRIPASTSHLPDVSLFDHAKMTAAFAICMHDYISEKKKQELPNAGEEPFLLIGGDLSGIQKFIYGIIAKGAAKNLKGRSFYLQMLIDSITGSLIDKLGLFDANIVYASGGGFYIIAPNTQNIRQKIDLFEKEITEKLFCYHKSELLLAIACYPFGEKHIFMNGDNKEKHNISEIWHALSEEISQKKSQPFITKLQDYQLFFEAGETGGIQTRDAITGEEVHEQEVCELENYNDNENQKNVIVSKYTFDQIKMGQKLRDVDYWLMADEYLSYFDFKCFNPCDTDKYNYLLTKRDLSEKEDKLKLSADKVRVLTINDTDFLKAPQKGIENIYGFCFYGGNKYPVSNYGDPKTFDEISGVEFSDRKKTEKKRSPGLLRMGVLRMDVDNLGAVFRRGLPVNKRSFSRYSTLSRSLDYFFKGYINIIWNQKEDYREFTQIIYSGGDDLFIVGKWDILIELANDINQSFRKWTCHNPDITISGGIVFVYPRFPILTASILSGQAEKMAKNHGFKGKTKNAFCLFGYAFDWENEYVYLLELKNTIKRLTHDKGLSSGFGSDMYNMMEQADIKFDENKNTYVINNYQVIWLTAYNFKRATQRTSEPELRAFFNNWIENIFTGRLPVLKKTRYHALQYLAIAARWANMETR